MTLLKVRVGRNGQAVDGRSRLEMDLREAVRGPVRFDRQARGLYAMDASNYRHIPVGVVVPRDVQDVQAAISVCRAHEVPIVSRGGGTSVSGGDLNEAVVLDHSRYMRAVLQVDPARGLARVQPGAVLDELRARTQKYGWTFGPDPSTHDRCTFGGMIGNNACGIHAVQSEFYGPGPRTDANVQELEVLTYDGARMRVGPTPDAEYEAIVRAGGRKAEIYRALRDLRDRYADRIREGFPELKRRVSGYNLPALLPEHDFHVAAALVGSEGTCVTVTEATVRLTRHFPALAMLAVGYPDVYEAAADVVRVREFQPIGIEGMDDLLVHYVKKTNTHAEHLPLLPEGGGWLLVEFGGQTREEAVERARACQRAVTHAPGLGALAKWAAGMAPTREVPRFASATFRRAYARQARRRRRRGDGPPQGNGRRVILWPDTFNNHFVPRTLHAAQDVLERAGVEVVIPPRPLCCGRPLYEYGMLDVGRKLFQRILDVLEPEVRVGTPVVGVEPSCIVALRDELPNMLPHDPRARRLSERAYSLEEYLQNELEGYEPPALEGRAVVQLHCQGAAILGRDAQVDLLTRTGLELEVLDSGCCGMAGAFGYERGAKHEVSVAAAQRMLLPALERTGDDVLVIADGFSCREQIHQLAGRRTLHVADALAAAPTVATKGEGA